MPRADEPRVPVRLSDSDHAIIKAAADSANVAVAGLMRECSVRYAGEVAREIMAGRITLRRQRVEPKPAPKRAVVEPSRGVFADVAGTRQQRLNADALRARGGVRK